MWSSSSLLPTFAAFLSLLPLISAATLKIEIPSSNLLPNPNTLLASTHATLTSVTSPQLHARLRKGNVLEFHEIPTTGTHLLDIFSRDYSFAPYRVDVNGSTIIGVWETYRGTQWSDVGPALLSAPSDSATVQAKVIAKKNFYEQRQGFSPLSLLKNPMILMGIAALAFTFGMPKLMENMDPETKAEYEEMQKNSPVAGITQAIGGGGGGAANFDLASWMAGASAPATKSSGADTGANGIRERKRG